MWRMRVGTGPRFSFVSFDWREFELQFSGYFLERPTYGFVAYLERHFYHYFLFTWWNNRTRSQAVPKNDITRIDFRAIGLALGFRSLPGPRQRQTIRCL